MASKRLIFFRSLKLHISRVLGCYLLWVLLLAVYIQLAWTASKFNFLPGKAIISNMKTSLKVYFHTRTRVERLKVLHLQLRNFSV